MVILNVKTEEVTVINPVGNASLRCFSDSFMEKQGHLLSLVCDSNSDNIHLIRFNQADKP